VTTTASGRSKAARVASNSAAASGPKAAWVAATSTRSAPARRQAATARATVVPELMRSS